MTRPPKRKMSERVSDVFKTVGQPTITYVERDSGRLEAQLENAIETSGQICLVTGPSKTGKTTLYKHVLKNMRREPLIVRCDKGLGPEEFWSRALESINFTRIKELASEEKVQTSFLVKLGGKLGWKWLAEASGEISAGMQSEVSETKAKEAILSRPGPMHLIPILKELPYVLVVEDYHYLSASAQQVIFQQWKYFVDEEVSVIVIGTSHHAIDVISANKDLLARKLHIQIPRWNETDLRKIVEKGFNYLDVPIASNQVRRIADESVGLPIVTQHVCEALFSESTGFVHTAGQGVKCDAEHVEAALRVVAKNKFSELGQWYNRLIVGPRKRARKYDTYELVLACFAENPLKFQLARHEITDRLANLPIDKERIPPVPSVNSMLNAVASFQEKQSFELLEWRSEDQILYMIEPLFLFYIRWGVVADSTDKVRSRIRTALSNSVLNALLSLELKIKTNVEEK